MSPLPGTFGSAAEMTAFRRAPERWLPSVTSLVRSLDLAGDPAPLGGSNLVAALGRSHVIKLVPPSHAHELAIEKATIEHIDDTLPIPVPRIVASGVHEAWPYVVMTRLEGAGMGTRSRELPGASIHGILRDVGRVASALHDLALPASGPIDDDWASFVTQHSIACVERQRRWGVPAHLVAQIPAFLERASLLSPFPLSKLALLHADIHDENVVVTRDASGWRLSGLLDFADAFCGDSLYELVTPALLIAYGKPALFAALLDGYGIPPPHRTEAFRTRLMACAILHRFNDLSRYTEWARTPPMTLDDLAKVMFPM